MSLLTPAPNAATAAPSWWKAKIHPKIMGPSTGPKNLPDNLTVGGTVAIKSNPKNKAHTLNENASKLL